MKTKLKAIALSAMLMFGASNAANAVVYRWSFTDNVNSGGIFAYLDFDTVTFDFRLADNNGQHPELSATNTYLTSPIGVNGIAFDFLNNATTINTSALTDTDGSGSIAWASTSIGTLSDTTQPGLPTGYNFGFASPNNNDNNEISNGESTMFNFGNIVFSNISGISLRVNTSNGALNSSGTWVSGQLVNGGAPVPEAETYAMFLAGLGLLGFVSRRRKQA